MPSFRACAPLLLAATLASLAAPRDAGADAPVTRRRKVTRPAAGRRAPMRRGPARPAPPPTVVTPDPASARDQQVAAACRRGMQGVAGSAVAMDPRTGRVIAIVNPALGVDRAYQPCSVFKIVVAIAGLTEGVITPDTVLECKGSCWFWPGHGRIDLRRALADSCNSYFQQVGGMLGYARIQKYARLLGLGEPSGINLAGEASGEMPVSMPEWAVPHMSSHADHVTTSAVQLAVLLSATVNGGVVYQPQIAPAQGFVPRERWRLPASVVMGGLYDGFVGAVDEGSAADAFDPDIPVAGKTGTCAGVGWFASYAPADRPEIVLVVFTRPGSGHYSSQVAGNIYEALYKGDAAVVAAPPSAADSDATAPR